MNIFEKVWKVGIKEINCKYNTVLGKLLSKK